MELKLGLYNTSQVPTYSNYSAPVYANLPANANGGDQSDFIRDFNDFMSGQQQA